MGIDKNQGMEIYLREKKKKKKITFSFLLITLQYLAAFATHLHIADVQR